MKKGLIVAILAFLIVSESIGQKAKNLPFPLGERIEFKIYYGWFALGEASMSIVDTMPKKWNKSYYHTRVEARTVGLFSWLAGVDNLYWGYVSPDNYKTILSEKHLDEKDGKYDQWNVFDYDRMQTDVKVLDHSKPDEGIESFSVDLTQDTYDLHGTYMYLRSQLRRDFKKGDSLLVKTYWSKKLYDFGMEYAGEEKIKFNGGKVKTKKYYGLFPVSKTFPKERAVTVYVLEKAGMSIPLLIEAEMKIGKVRCELKEYTVGGKQLLTSE
ncbi:MAG: DUF3108 domain-containing protein [Marinoscillum sp.]